MKALGYPGLVAHEQKYIQLIEDFSNKIPGVTLGNIAPEAIQDLLFDLNFAFITPMKTIR